ncbi:hypothetical protein [Staphylococcus ratti]|uniref:Transposase n=1 Tax=Staphylococcus ratti TaxID=2892440 RepID=A0ABY3PAG9_9STAP|nr:hypothetical protein [Staphylococcus ratti]UEX89276.1 hypothetical protein LN051_06730 [Staphylococcus ratti]
MVCWRAYTAKTNVVEDNCFISNHIQKAIIDKATQVRSKTDIASDCNVSASSIKHVIHKVSNEITMKPTKGLPSHLAMDEFKSVKNISGSLSFISFGYRNFYNFKNRIFINFRLYKRPKKKAMPLLIVKLLK